VDELIELDVEAAELDTADDVLEVVAVDDAADDTEEVTDEELLVDIASEDDDELCMNATDGTSMEISVVADTTERECFFI
jgi:hypothetical protein